MRVLVGQVLGLFELGADARHPRAPLAAREIAALVREGRRTWVLSEGADDLVLGGGRRLGRHVAFGTDQGDLWVSADEGRHWSVLARGLPEVRCVALA